MTTSKLKDNLRIQLRKKRQEVGSEPELKTHKETLINEFLVELLSEILGSGALLSYKALGDEVDLSSLEQNFKKVAYPRVEGPGVMEFYFPEGPFVSGSYGIQEPNPSCATKVLDQENLVILVPGLGFDREGRRLGMGGGYYDRFLQNLSGIKIGIGFVDQFLEENLPVEDHDVLMDFIVTDQFVLKPRLENVG